MKSITNYITNNININESKLNEDELKNMIIAAVSSLGKGFDVDIQIGGESIDDSVSQLVIQNSMGHIIENVVAGGFIQKFGSSKVKHVSPKEKLSEGENPSCDIILYGGSNGSCNIEIKAYKTLGNIKPTSGQWKADYILCVKYSLSGKHVTIEEVNCVNPGDNVNKAHIKVTREMINNGITVKN